MDDRRDLPADVDFSASAKIGAHDRANEMERKTSLDLLPRLHAHCPQISLAETGLAIQFVKAGIVEPEAREPPRQDVETFPCRLNIAQPIADIVGRQRAAMFVRLFLRRWNLEQIGQGSERVRLAGERRRKRLHVNKVAPVGSCLLVCLVGTSSSGSSSGSSSAVVSVAGRSPVNRISADRCERCLTATGGQSSESVRLKAASFMLRLALAWPDCQARQIEGEVETDDLSADGVGRSIKDLVDKLGAGSQTYALAVRVRAFVIDDLSKDRELLLAQDVGLIESAAFPNLAFVAQLIAAEPQPLIGGGAGFAIEHQNPVAGRRPGRKVAPIDGARQCAFLEASSLSSASLAPF